MPSVIYLAERDSLTFEAGRTNVDVVCAGDSITGWNNFGLVGDWPYRTYPASLQKLSEPLGLTIANGGIAREVSGNGLGQIRDDLGLFPNARYFVLGYGANDLDKAPDVEEASRRVIENLDRMVGAVWAARRTAVLLGVPNADESRVPPEEAESWRAKLTYHNARLREYCLAHRVPLADAFGKLGAGHFDDPFHPNEEGTAVIAGEVFRMLDQIRKTSP